MNWIENVRADMVCKGISDTGVSAMLEFCERHDCVPTQGTVDLWGFGEAPVMFEVNSGGWWVALVALVGPSGVGYDRLVQMWEEEREEWGSDSTGILDLNDGNPSLEMIRHDFVMRAFANESPWRREFYENTKELMRHAMLNSGLAAEFDKAGIQTIEGEGFTGAITQGLPSEEVAKHAAHAGPLGAFNPGN